MIFLDSPLNPSDEETSCFMHGMSVEGSPGEEIDSSCGTPVSKTDNLDPQSPMVGHGDVCDTDEGNSPLSDEATSGFVEGYPGERIDLSSDTDDLDLQSSDEETSFTTEVPVPINNDSSRIDSSCDTPVPKTDNLGL